MTEEFTGPKTKVEMTMTKDGETKTKTGNRPTDEALAFVADDTRAEIVKGIEQATGAKFTSIKVSGIEVHADETE